MRESKPTRYTKVGSIRKCHRCGKPTTDYMCYQCWLKMQGFHPNSTDDYSSPEILGGYYGVRSTARHATFFD